MAGAERSLLEGVKGLCSENLSVQVVVPSSGPLVQALSSLQVPVSVMRYDWWMSPRGWKSSYYRTRHGVVNFTVWLKVLRYLRKLHPDLVVTNTLTTPIWAIASKYLGLPHVWYVHESGSADGDVFDLGERRTFKLIDALSLLIIVNSESTRANLSQAIPSEKLRLVQYAVEIPQGCDRLKADDEVFRLALVGRVSPNKGHAEAIEALALLVRRGLKVHLKIIGETESGFSRLLRRRTDELDLKGRVEFVPFTENPFSHLTDADIALMCSHREAFGRVTVEAMKMGKPVVGAAVDGTRELIQHGLNGFLYEVGNATDLADKISLLYHDRAKVNSMGEAARVWATERFTIKGYANDLLGIFEEAIGKPQHGPVVNGNLGRVLENGRVSIYE
jgi:glycosyltransferase involved in cell wall biosynthesis